VLGKVIAALVQGKSHVPYFESKLTTMLKAAFGGNSRTTVVVNCRTDGDSGDETLQSMRFGERCAMISNSMRIAASSYQSALAAVDQALSTVQGQLKSLEARGKQQLPSYKALLHSYQALSRKRFELAGIDAAATAAPQAQD
jgi:kinesin family protein 5